METSVRPFVDFRVVFVNRTFEQVIGMHAGFGFATYIYGAVHENVRLDRLPTTENLD